MNKLEILEKILEDLNPSAITNRLALFKFGLVEEETSTGYYDEKSQGDYGILTSVYYNNEENLYLQVTKETDSYGENEHIKSIKYVTPISKTVTIYE
jgi:hypothetical protein